MNTSKKYELIYAIVACIIAILIPIVGNSIAEVKPSSGWIKADIVIVLLMCAVSIYVFAYDKQKFFIGVIAYFVLAAIMMFAGGIGTSIG